MYVYIHMVDIQCTGIYKCIYRNVHKMLGLKLYICIYTHVYKCIFQNNPCIILILDLVRIYTCSCQVGLLTIADIHVHVHVCTFLGNSSFLYALGTVLNVPNR